MIEYIQYCLSFVLFCFILFFVFSGLTHTAQQISTMIPGNTCVSPGKTQKEQRNSIKMANLQDRIQNYATENFKITAGGCLVLGQDQDSIGGPFDREQTLHGRLASVNMWDKVLSESDIAAQYTSCSVPSGSVFNWSVFKNLAHGNVTIKQP